MPATTISPITATIPPFTVTPTINTPTFPEDIDVYNTELPGVIAGQGTLTSQLNTFIGQVGTLEANVIALEASTLGAADIAAASANFKGTWVGATSYPVPSSVYYNGVYFIALQPNSNQTPNPDTNTAYWAPWGIASSIKYTPSGEVSATTVQSAIDELSTEKLSVVNIHSSTDKVTPVDADELPLMDSASSFSLKKLTWSNIKATLKIYFDTLYVALSGNQTIAGIKTFSSSPIIPTPTAGDNSTKAATTAYVDGKMVIATEVTSTSGTSIDFTGIPSWAKRITVMFNGVSTNGTSILMVQLGDSGGIENTGYVGSVTSIGVSPASISLSSGFTVASGWAATSVMYGKMVLDLQTTNTFNASSILGRSDSPFVTMLMGGSKTLSAALTTVRITTVNGTDAFDAGSINIMYEG